MRDPMHEPLYPIGTLKLQSDVTYLKELRITDFALVESAVVKFGVGLNCITGESGSGKSVMVDALGLISGAPTPLADCIRGSAPQATIEGVYSLDGRMAREVRALLVACGLPSRALPPLNSQGPCELLIRREIVRGAASAPAYASDLGLGTAVRSKAFINGSASSLKVLKDLGSILLDANVQNSASELKDHDTQLELLDKVAGTTAIAGSLKALLGESKRIEESLLQLDELEDEEERDGMQAMVDACRRIKLSLDEEVRLRQALKNIEGRRNSVEQCTAVRNGGSGITQAIKNLEVQLSVVMKQEIQLREAESLTSRAIASSSNVEDNEDEDEGDDEDEDEDPSSSDDSSFVAAGEAAVEALQSAREQLVIAEGHVRVLSRLLQFDPGEHGRLTERLKAVEKALKAFGCKTSYQLLRKVEEAEERLRSFHEAEEHEEEWQGRLGELTGEIRASSIELSRRRRASAALMGPSVQSCLSELAMSQSRFQVNVKWSPSNIDLGTSQGVGSIPQEVLTEFNLEGDLEGRDVFKINAGGSLDSVSFVLSSGPHEALKSLAAVASGGEAARLVLALKAAPSLMRGDADPIEGATAAPSSPVLVLDELDSSIGARLGSAVGKILRRMVEGGGGGARSSRNRQIICITHLPQVAAFADHHVRVRKVNGTRGESSEVESGRVRTVFEHLESKEERTDELAAMLGLDQSAVAELLLIAD